MVKAFFLENTRPSPAFITTPLIEMLVCQALEEGRPVITKDEMIARYPVSTIW